MNKETWKDVIGYAGLYQVSDLGRIRSLGRECNSKNGSKQRKRERILIQEVTIHGYCRVRLFDAEGKAKHYAVHRLVMNAFVGVLDEEINHINEIKTDNRLCNLEYCSHTYNCNYGTRNVRIAESNKWNRVRPVMQIDKNDNVIATYPSRVIAEIETGIDARHIGSVCGGKRKTAGGYKWRDA
jgi:hypothetical protein